MKLILWKRGDDGHFFPSATGFYRNMKSGFSLIEAAVVLAIVGLVLGGIWVAYKQVNYFYQRQQFQQGLLTMKESAAKYLSQSEDCSGGAYLYWTDRHIYDLLYPQEWKNIDISRFISWGINAPFISCDANGIRTLYADYTMVTHDVCHDTLNFLTSKPGITLVTSSWHCNSTGKLRIKFDIPRRS